MVSTYSYAPELRAAERARLPAAAPDRAGIGSFVRRIWAERNLYGSLAFAETCESLSLIRRALSVTKNDRVAGVTSSGDVLLSFLADEADGVAGFDANPTQTALAHLKLAAIQNLEVPAYLRLMGVANDDAPARLDTFDRISRAMPGDERAAMIARRSWIGGGVLNRGMTHLIIRTMVRSLARVVDQATLSLFVGRSGTTEERAWVLDRTLSKRRVRLGLEPALRAFAPQLQWMFFPHRICRVSDRPEQMISDFFETFRPLFVRGAMDNPVLCRSATGAIHPEWKTHLYDGEVFERVRERSDRIRFSTSELTSGLRSLPAGWATKLYLSNVPDYLEPDGLDQLGTAIRHAAAPGARVLYFSLCDEDRLGTRIGPRIPDGERAALQASDNVHLYPSIEVRKVVA